ncbi:MAG: AraC family transcriptional regulator [Bacteroidota bacterium]|jgi:AraC-like DNA-binding protein
MNLLFIAGIGVAVFIEFLLISKKQKSVSDRILTLWMFLIIVHLFMFYLFFTGDIFHVPFLLGLEHPLPLLHGVFLYYYVSFVTGQLPRNRKILFLHLLPAGVMYGYLLSFIFLPTDQKIAVYRSGGAGYEWFNFVKLYAITLSGIVYVIVSAVMLRRHRNTIRDRFSDLERVSLRWLQILTFGLGGIWLLVLLFRSEPLIFSGVVIFVFLIGFFGVRQGDIFAHNQSKPETEVPQDGSDAQETEIQGMQPENAEQRKKYTKSGLSDEVAGDLHAALIALMVKNELHKKSDLSINDLASTLAVHPNYLSQVINQREQKNFYDFVNFYRIQAFKRLIEANKNQQFTLLSIAYDCGFSSKSSFNRCFKKETGQTPSQFAASFSRDQR